MRPTLHGKKQDLEEAQLLRLMLFRLFSLLLGLRPLRLRPFEKLAQALHIIFQRLPQLVLMECSGRVIHVEVVLAVALSHLTVHSGDHVSGEKRPQ